MWTPDGEKLVFVTGDSNGYAQIASIPSAIPSGPIDIRLLTEAPHNSLDPHVSPDGRWIAFTSDRRGRDDVKGDDIWLMPVDGGVARLLTPDSAESLDYAPRWSPDGRLIAFVSNRTGWRNIGLVDVATGATRMLTTSAWDEANPQWSPDGQWIAYVANKNWNLQVMKVGVDGGAPVPLGAETGVSGGMQYGQSRGTLRWSPDGGTIAYTYMSPTNCSDIWVMNPDGMEARQLTDHMPAGLSDGDFVRPERIAYASRDGLEIPAFLYRPVGPMVASSSGKPPLLLYARANTHGHHLNGFYPFIQYFVSLGYVVLVPQVRGSQGLGREFEWLNYGDWGGGDVDDLVAGIEYLESEGWIDPERVVMQGGSTGGFFVMSMLHRYPDRIQAAVNLYGPTNLVHMYDMWAPAERPILGDVVGGDLGPPSVAPDHWRERSAYFNIDSIRTPLLILWGDRDYSVRISMADEYFELAKAKSKPTEYVLYDDEPHGWYHWRPADLRDAMLRVAKHYETHIGR